MKPSLAAAVAACLGLTLFATETPRRVYIAPDDHTDYVWTADEETYRRAFVETIDYYLEHIEKSAHYRPEHQARWNCDGSLWMWTYERSKPPEQFQRFLERVRDGHISVPLNAVASCYGGMPMEAVLRGMYYAGRVERRYNLGFPLAVAMENQTLPYGLGALWAGSGAKYSWRGICGCASRLERVKNSRRPHEIYWWQGPDASRILMKWNTLHAENKCVGGYAEAFSPEKSLQWIESSDEFRKTWPYRIMGLFGKGWDNLTTMDDEIPALARRATTPERTIIVSNERDFFEDFERTYGKDLPVFSAGFGNEWDLYISSVAETASRARRSVEKLRTAEALATLVSLRYPAFLNGREAERDLAFMNLGLLWEHNWTADGPVSRQARADWGRRLVGQIESYVDRLESDAAHALGAMIPKSGRHPRFYVFNALGWTRSDIADLPWDGPSEIHVVDAATGTETPSQMVTLESHDYGKGRKYLRILAKDIPAAGYRVFEIRPGPPAASTQAPAASEAVLENTRYRLSVSDSGAITSFVDKTRAGRELVRIVEGRAINDIGGADGTLTTENAGPVSVTMRAEVAAPLARTTRITLFRDIDRVDIVNELKQNFSEVLTWSFGLNLDRPEVWHEEVGAILRARLTTDGGHYSPVHSRLDWLTLNHFVAMSGADGAGVTLSNADLAFMKLGSSEVIDGVSKLDTTTPRISVLAGGQVDGPQLGVPAQGGDSRFLHRFALRTHSRFHPAESMKFALEHQNPLRTGMITGGSGYPAESYSLARVSGDDVLLWALKPADEGIEAGVIARVWNLAPQRRSFSLRFAPGLASAGRATHIETDLEAARASGDELPGSLEPGQISSYRLRPARPGR